MVKHSSLLQKSINYDRKKCYNIGPRVPDLRRHDDLPLLRRGPHDLGRVGLHLQLVVQPRPRHLSPLRVALQVLGPLL